MSKSKEQCINIINKQFNNLKDEKDEQTLFQALEESIIDISSAEFALTWLVNNKTNRIKTFYKNKSWELELEDSILKKVFVSKEGFFDNYVVSHLKYNPKIDNILNVNIKSMIVVPILDKAKNEVVSFIVALNSVNYKEKFRRYDIRSLGLLSHFILKLIDLSTLNDINISPPLVPKIVKKELVEERKKKIPISREKREFTRSTRKTKSELEKELQLQKIKLKSLEEELLLKTEALENREEEIKQYALTVIEEKVIEPVFDNNSDIYTIVNFLNNEVSYLANEEHTLYLFLEILKNSLHNKEQLHFLNRELEKLELIEKLANALYTREKMPIFVQPFNLYQLVTDISTLYSKIFSDKNITFNIFLNPITPNIIVSDKDKIKSLIIHLINNIFNFTTESGAIELSINFSNIDELLILEVKSFDREDSEKIKNFFAHKEINHSLKYSESGLGLSVGSNLIKILNGKLKLSARGEDEHIFTVSLPIKKGRESKVLDFIDNNFRVAIVMSKENSLAVENLILYLLSMGVDEKFIFTFESAKKIKGLRISHLFCFENMFVNGLDFNGISSITLLKYSQKKLNIHKNGINTLYVNSYYGLELQRILFPYMESIEFIEKTFLMEDSFLTKFSNVVKKLKLS